MTSMHDRIECEKKTVQIESKWSLGVRVNGWVVHRNAGPKGWGRFVSGPLPVHRRLSVIKNIVLISGD